MPDRNSIQYLEVKKRLSLLEKNLLSAIQNISAVTLEMEKLRNALAAKEGFEEIAENIRVPTVAPPAAPAVAAEGDAAKARRGPSQTNMTSTKGRTLKVINN